MPAEYLNLSLPVYRDNLYCLLLESMHLMEIQALMDQPYCPLSIDLMKIQTLVYQTDSLLLLESRDLLEIQALVDQK